MVKRTRKKKENAKLKYLQIRIEDELKEKFEHLAEMKGMTLSKYIRSLIDLEIKKTEMN